MLVWLSTRRCLSHRHLNRMNKILNTLGRFFEPDEYDEETANYYTYLLIGLLVGVIIVSARFNQ